MDPKRERGITPSRSQRYPEDGCFYFEALQFPLQPDGLLSEDIQGDTLHLMGTVKTCTRVLHVQG